MKEETATLVADVLLVAAAGAVTWVVLRDPRLRRPVFRMLRTLVTATLPTYFAHEIRTAWAESGRREEQSMMAG